MFLEYNKRPATDPSDVLYSVLPPGGETYAISSKQR